MVSERDQVSVEVNKQTNETRPQSVFFFLEETPRSYWSVPAGVDDHDEFVPLGAVSDRQLDLAQREVIGP